MKFTERLMDYGLTLDEDVIICDRRVVDQAADIIDELERALRLADEYVQLYAVRNALTKLERLV